MLRCRFVQFNGSLTGLDLGPSREIHEESQARWIPIAWTVVAGGAAAETNIRMKPSKSEEKTMSTSEVPADGDFRARAKMNDVAIARLIGFEAKDITHGHATVTLAAGPQHANPMGTLHGGVLCDIADAAMGIAFASTLEPGESFTTIELKINFFRPVWEAQLKAEGTVIRRGRNVGYAECEIFDERGQLIAKAASTCLALRGDDTKGR
jgi:uncharacterized protein (TIGR00369 family)